MDKEPNNLQKFLFKLPLVKQLLEFAKRLVIPGFEGLSIFEVSKFFFRGIGQTSLTMRASAMAFKFFLAVFPAIIFLFTLIAYIPIEDLHDDILSYLKNIMPKDAYSVTVTTIEDLLKNKHSGLLSFGFLVTIYLASDGIHAMMEAFNHSFHAVENRTGFKQRLVSLLLVFILTFLLVVSAILIVFSEFLVDFLVNYGLLRDSITFTILVIGKWCIILVLFTASISIIYFLGPVHKARFRIFSAGSTFATAFIILFSLGFAYYINNFGQYNKLYGSIGTLMVVMLWIYFNSLVLLLGFELNATIFSIKALQKKDKP